MKRRMGLIAVLLVVSSVLSVPDVSALERSTPIAAKLADESPYFLGEMNGELYFSLQSHLWKTDGTPAGTLLLSPTLPLGPHSDDFGPPDCLPIALFCPHHYPKGAAANGLFFFAADDGVHGTEVWRSDGTPAGTSMVKDIDATDSARPEDFVGVNNVMFLTRSHPGCLPQCELWRSDGTEAGTFFLTAMPTGALIAASVNGALLFQKGADIWRSDGTVVGTSVFMPGAKFLTATADRLFFTSATHLWATDGTSSTPLTAFPVRLHMCVNAVCYFSERTLSGSEGIWRTAGTPADTIKLASMDVSDATLEFVDVNGTVYFTNGDELWKTNDTPVGTILVRDQIAFPYGLASAYGQLFFISSGQLWKSDGTTTGTGMVTGFGDNRTLTEIIVAKGKLLLRVYGPPCQGIPCDQDWHLYTSDGSPAGTEPLADLAQRVLNCPTPLCSANNFVPNNSSVIDGDWFFEALDSVSGSPRLWMATYIFFQDVAPDHWAFSWVERLAEDGITGGCNPDRYCPDGPVSRDQMAVFLLRGIHGSGYQPPAATGTVFTDVPTSQPFANWIEQLARERITGGCSTSPPQYCPDSGVTRGQMAVFLLRAKHGAGYQPPAATGTMFTDVPLTQPFAKWIEQLAREGITGGCGPTTYCPDATVTRGEMAVFLVRTFNLPH